MKRILTSALMILFVTGLFAQTDSTVIPPNAILKDFKPLPTPRTNYRPGTVYRVDENGKVFFVEDIKAIPNFSSEEGTLTGRITMTKKELLTTLNVEINAEYAVLEIEIKDAFREFNEQTAVDRVLWDGDKAETLLTYPSSKYYIIRETVSSSEITYRISENTFSRLISGKGSFKKATPRGDEVIDFPYSILKKFKEPHRLFYLDQEVGLKIFSRSRNQ